MRQIGLPREGAHIAQGGEGNMQEKPDLTGEAQLAQLGGEGEEMVVVNPDHIVRPGHFHHLPGKARVDSAIPPLEAAVELDQITAAVTDRPKHRVRKTEVEILVIFVR